MKSFYNTNAETGDSLIRCKIHARSQQEAILAHFKINPGRHYTPAEIQAVFPTMLLTSIRRAICNLTDAGYLVKTELRTPGIYGSPNFNWRLKTNGGHEQRRLF